MELDVILIIDLYGRRPIRRKDPVSCYVKRLKNRSTKCDVFASVRNAWNRMRIVYKSWNRADLSCRGGGMY